MENIIQEGGLLPREKRILFLGDSITDDGRFIALMKNYFFQHMPDNCLDFINLGVSSETVSGLSEPDHPFPRPCIHERIDRVLELSKPDWVVICYGMNDGIYYPLSEQRFELYQKGLLGLIKKIKSYGAKAIIMTPPPFYAPSAKNCRLLPEGAVKYSYIEPYKDYDDVIRTYGEWILYELKDVADKVIDLYKPMQLFIDTRRQADPKYIYGDGIHPDLEGHWIIAKVLLRELFIICLERIPEHVVKPENSYLFKLIMEYCRVLHHGWKEYVGHTNPSKEQALPIGEAVIEASHIKQKILQMKKSQNEESLTKITLWKGYERHDFYYKGREAILVKPKVPAEGNPWVWRAEFFDRFSYADMALLQKGWHLVYYRLSDMSGCPGAVEMMSEFQDYISEIMALSEKTVLFGFSRGGFYSVNYAARYPERVAIIYLDAPALDIFSWPGGKGRSTFAPQEWDECLALYGLNEETVKGIKGNAIDNIEPVAKAGIAIILVIGDADTAAIYEENGERLVKAYTSMGGKIKLIIKPGVGHHPHSLEDPTEIVEYITGNI